jgi:hypothetical protein
MPLFEPTVGVREGEGMTVTVSLPLFGAAGQELEEGQPVRGQHLRDLAAALHERLLASADLVERLVTGGWSARVALCDVIFSCASVQTRADAERRLRELEADPELFVIFEEVAEDDVD